MQHINCAVPVQILSHPIEIRLVNVDVLFWRMPTGNVIVAAARGAEHRFHAILRHWPVEPLLVASGQCDRPYWRYAVYLVAFLKIALTLLLFER